jgi:hypothetical protein
MLLAGRRTHKMKHFYGFEGILWVWIMGSQNVMGSDFGSNISVAQEESSCYAHVNFTYGFQNGGYTFMAISSCLHFFVTPESHVWVGIMHAVAVC